MEACVIRSGHTFDSVRLAELTRQFFPYLHLSADAIFDRMKNGVQYLVLEKNGALLGFVDFEYTSEPNARHKTAENPPLHAQKAAKILGLCVVPEFQGKGFGKKLFMAALNEASRYSNQVVVLVEESNAKAIRLYESAGFKRHGKLAEKLWDRDVLMYTKTL
ncbi:MAG: GNAT family N-acetyltransferase [Candidatus Micrarchaeota archaeon]|nr:GNAT family N-acetyltransferase [Candidatus Micrarchaeota archaeon]